MYTAWSMAFKGFCRAAEVVEVFEEGRSVPPVGAVLVAFAVGNSNFDPVFERCLGVSAAGSAAIYDDGVEY